MKIISFVVPCYNSENYMKKCIDSLLIGGEAIEIIIVNDGSTDKTTQIANEYEKAHPNIVKVIHKDNGGHGSGVNTGLQHSTGCYFKVVDSDDWVDKDSLLKIIEVLSSFIKSNIKIDLLISNYVYEHITDNTQNSIKYSGYLPENKIFSWKDIKRVDPVRYMMMHSMTYRTQLLRDSNLVLPEHTFYVDNLVVYVPLAKVETLYYLNTDFYRYYIGRSDQSISEKILVERVEQHVRVTSLMRDAHDIYKIKSENKMLGKHLLHYLSIMYTITSALFALKNTKESDKLSEQFWNELKTKDKRLYIRIRFFSKAFFMSMPGTLGKFISRFLYKIVRKAYKFN